MVFNARNVNGNSCSRNILVACSCEEIWLSKLQERVESVGDVYDVIISSVPQYWLRGSGRKTRQIGRMAERAEMADQRTKGTDMRQIKRRAERRHTKVDVSHNTLIYNR